LAVLITLKKISKRKRRREKKINLIEKRIKNTKRNKITMLR
jgi:hypothetical protein